MISRIGSLLRDRRGAAAAEMALVLPLLLTIMFGSLELGNYFMNEHTLVKAVRDGSRFAARQAFTNYTACSGKVGEPAYTETKNVVMTGYRAAGSTIITPRIETSDIEVTTSCKTTAGGQTMSGIYAGRDVNGDGQNDAQIVLVDAAVNYQPIIGFFGIPVPTMQLKARSEAAVAGM
jgi:Flp pilus assembly protein TadG